MLAVTVNLDVLLVGIGILRSPVGELPLAAVERLEPGVRCRGADGNAGDGNAADGVDHRFVAPPTLPLVSPRLWLAGKVEKAEPRRDCRPSSRFAEVINAGPKELAGLRRIVAQGQPYPAVMALLRADDFARGFCLMSGEQFVVAVIRADDVQHVGQAVVVVMADVRPEQGLGHRPGGIVFVADLDQAFEDALGEFRFRRVVDFVAGAVENELG